MRAQHVESVALDRFVAAGVGTASVAILLFAAGTWAPIAVAIAVVVGLILLRA